MLRSADDGIALAYERSPLLGKKSIRYRGHFVTRIRGSICELKQLLPRCPRKTLLHWVSLAERQSFLRVRTCQTFFVSLPLKAVWFVCQVVWFATTKNPTHQVFSREQPISRSFWVFGNALGILKEIG